jgi:hypothetical protein
MAVSRYYTPIADRFGRGVLYRIMKIDHRPWTIEEPDPRPWTIDHRRGFERERWYTTNMRCGCLFVSSDDEPWPIVAGLYSNRSIRSIHQLFSFVRVLFGENQDRSIPRRWSMVDGLWSFFRWSIVAGRLMLIITVIECFFSEKIWILLQFCNTPKNHLAFG